MKQVRRQSNEQLAAEANSFDVDAYVTALDIEIEHFRDLFSKAPEPLRAELGLSVEEHGNSLLFTATQIPHLLFTRGHLGGSGRLDEAEIDSMLASLKEKGVETFLIHADARLPIVETRRALEARGLAPYRRPWVKLVRGREPVPDVDCDLEVREITVDDAETCAAMMMNVFGLPSTGTPAYVSTVGREGWRWYLASDNGEPAATGVLFQKGPVAYLAGGVTLPRFRRRKAQRALMRRRIVDALGAGAEQIASETGFPFADEENPSYRNMMYFGLRAVGTRHNFGPPGAKW